MPPPPSVVPFYFFAWKKIRESPVNLWQPSRWGSNEKREASTYWSASPRLPRYYNSTYKSTLMYFFVLLSTFLSSLYSLTLHFLSLSYRRTYLCVSFRSYISTLIQYLILLYLYLCIKYRASLFALRQQSTHSHR